MKPFPLNVSDTELIDFIDGWVELLEARDYQRAYQYTDHEIDMGWTAQLIGEVIEGYGNAEPDQRATVEGEPTDSVQRKEVDRWSKNRSGTIGEIWYDLNISGKASDLTATFMLREAVKGVTVHLNDIHVM